MTEEEEREARAWAITVLLGATETVTEFNALCRVGRRTGFLWRCPACKSDRYANTDACCDLPRPTTA
jgi:hypothetical protein